MSFDKTGECRMRYETCFERGFIEKTEDVVNDLQVVPPRHGSGSPEITVDTLFSVYNSDFIP